MAFSSGNHAQGVARAAKLLGLPAAIVMPADASKVKLDGTAALPRTEIFVAEPEGWDDMGRSLVGGAIVEVATDAPPTACDALQTRRVADRTFAVLRDAGARGVAASEAEHRAAMRFAFRLGLVVEPGGAVALAAALAGKSPDDGKETVVICSGSNVDAVAFAAVITEEAV